MDIQYKKLVTGETESILNLWNHNIGVLFPLDKVLLKQNVFNGNEEKGLIYGAFYQERLIGMISCKCYKDIGYISFLIVDVAFRKIGIGSQFLIKAEEYFHENGVSTIHLGSDPYHFFPGVPSNFHGARAFFQHNGYQEGTQSFDLICDVSKINFETILEMKKPPIVKDGRYFISLFKKEDFSNLNHFFEKNFPDRWHEETIAFIKLSGQYGNLIILKERLSDSIIGFCRIYTEESKILGPSVYWRNLLGDSYGGLGPIGIDIDYRKKGLGLTFLYQSLEVLKKRKVKKMVIDWTVLLDFYGTFNFLPWKTYVHTSKTIK